MSKWYGKITANPQDITPLVDAVVWFENQLESARLEVKLRGNIEKASARLPGLVEQRFRELQEVEAILKYLELQHTRAKSAAFKMFLEGYARTLTSRDAERYADADDKVIEAAMLINQVALVRNQYLAVMKGLDIQHWQLSNIVKLRTAGMEDSEV